MAAAYPEEKIVSSMTARWYALHVQSRLAGTASTVLRGKGYEVLLPLYRSRRRWSDRMKEVELPLFPGYLFCRFDVHDRLLPVLTTPGVKEIVGAGKTPIPIAAEEIEAVRRVVSSGLATMPWPELPIGGRIYIEAGPLAGLEGIITNTDKVCRLVVSITMLERSVAVEIERDWVRLVTPKMGPWQPAFPPGFSTPPFDDRLNRNRTLTR